MHLPERIQDEICFHITSLSTWCVFYVCMHVWQSLCCWKWTKISHIGENKIWYTIPLHCCLYWHKTGENILYRFRRSVQFVKPIQNILDRSSWALTLIKLCHKTSSVIFLLITYLVIMHRCIDMHICCESFNWNK